MRLHRLPSPSMIVALVALTVALGGTSYAAVKLPKSSVGSAQLKNNAVTSPKVKNGSLKVEDFATGQLPKGDTGAAGPRGATGPAGTVDTSNFYDKAASDARFLGTGATAANSSQFGGLAPSAFVHGNGSHQVLDTTAQGGTSASLATGTVGHLTVGCYDPATTATINYVMANGRTGTVLTDTGAANPTRETVSSGGSTAQLSTTAADHLEFYVKSGSDNVHVDAWVNVAPGGANTCTLGAVIDTDS